MARPDPLALACAALRVSTPYEQCRVPGQPETALHDTADTDSKAETLPPGRPLSARSSSATRDRPLVARTGRESRAGPELETATTRSTHWLRPDAGPSGPASRRLPDPGLPSRARR